MIHSVRAWSVLCAFPRASAANAATAIAFSHPRLLLLFIPVIQGFYSQLKEGLVSKNLTLSGRPSTTRRLCKIPSAVSFSSAAPTSSPALASTSSASLSRDRSIIPRSDSEPLSRQKRSALWPPAGCARSLCASGPAAATRQSRRKRSVQWAPRRCARPVCRDGLMTPPTGVEVHAD